MILRIGNDIRSLLSKLVSLRPRAKRGGSNLIVNRLLRPLPLHGVYTDPEWNEGECVQGQSPRNDKLLIFQKHYECHNFNTAFTLVELMLSVVILGFGLCVVIQSYMSALSGFNTSQNYIAAMRFAKEKEAELEISAYENKGLLPETKSDEITLGTRKFNWKTEVREISNSGNFSKDFVMATVSMDWQERDIHKNSAIVTYLPKRKELEVEE